jgi:hypothetical protein
MRSEIEREITERDAIYIPAVSITPLSIGKRQWLPFAWLFRLPDAATLAWKLDRIRCNPGANVALPRWERLSGSEVST